MKNSSLRTAQLSRRRILFLALILFSSGCEGSRRNEAPAPVQPHSIALSWTPSAAPSVVGYNIFRDSIPGPVGVKLNAKPLTEAQYQDTTVESGRTYSYFVTAVDARGRESGPSIHVTAKVPAPEDPSFVLKLFHLFRSRS